jgi:uncharacterized Tic20 family protein
MGIPFGHLLGPLTVWLFKRKTYPFVDAQGRESLNFQLSMTLYALIAALLILMKLGMVFLFLLAIVNVLLVIIASLRAFNGETFHYPFKITIIR